MRRAPGLDGDLFLRRGLCDRVFGKRWQGGGDDDRGERHHPAQTKAAAHIVTLTRTAPTRVRGKWWMTGKQPLSRPPEASRQLTIC